LVGTGPSWALSTRIFSRRKRAGCDVSSGLFLWYCYTGRRRMKLTTLCF
jgi:hypothetical protein